MIDPSPVPTTTSRGVRPLTDGPAVAADLTAVLVFVLLGRTSHREESVVAGTLGTAWPFWVGAALGWVAVLLLRRRGRLPDPLAGRSLPAGVVVLGGTVIGGMLLRRLTGGGTPPSFLVVATAFLAALLLGWRALLGRVRPRRGPA